MVSEKSPCKAQNCLICWFTVRKIVCRFIKFLECSDASTGSHNLQDWPSPVLSKLLMWKAKIIFGVKFLTRTLNDNGSQQKAQFFVLCLRLLCTCSDSRCVFGQHVDAYYKIAELICPQRRKSFISIRSKKKTRHTPQTVRYNELVLVILSSKTLTDKAWITKEHLVHLFLCLLAHEYCVTFMDTTVL